MTCLWAQHLLLLLCPQPGHPPNPKALGTVKATGRCGKGPRSQKNPENRVWVMVQQVKKGWRALPRAAGPPLMQPGSTGQPIPSQASSLSPVHSLLAGQGKPCQATFGLLPVLEQSLFIRSPRLSGSFPLIGSKGAVIGGRQVVRVGQAQRCSAPVNLTSPRGPLGRGPADGVQAWPVSRGGTQPGPLLGGVGGICLGLAPHHPGPGGEAGGDRSSWTWSLQIGSGT